MALLSRHKHLVLLVLLLAAQVALPLVGHESPGARVAFDLLFGVAVLATALIVFGLARERAIAFALALPAFLLTLSEYFLPTGSYVQTAVAFHVSIALFLGYAVAVIVRDIFRRHAIAFDEVLGAFAGYILVGILWGSLYAATELLAPGSFNVNPEIRWQLQDWHLRRALFNYFSFATMASLGYSDITAIAPLANTLTWIEVMAAQFYLAVVIAQIVGLKVAQAIAQARHNGG